MRIQQMLVTLLIVIGVTIPLLLAQVEGAEFKWKEKAAARNPLNHFQRPRNVARKKGNGPDAMVPHITGEEGISDSWRDAICPTAAHPHRVLLTAFYKGELDQKLHKELDKAAELVYFDTQSEDIAIRKVNCKIHEPFCDEYGRKDYPFFVTFDHGNEYIEYQGNWTATSISQFLLKIFEKTYIDIADEETPINHYMSPTPPFYTKNYKRYSKVILFTESVEEDSMDSLTASFFKTGLQSWTHYHFVAVTHRESREKMGMENGTNVLFYTLDRRYVSMQPDVMFNAHFLSRIIDSCNYPIVNDGEMETVEEYFKLNLPLFLIYSESLQDSFQWKALLSPIALNYRNRFAFLIIPGSSDWVMKDMRFSLHLPGQQTPVVTYDKDAAHDISDVETYITNFETTILRPPPALSNQEIMDAVNSEFQKDFTSQFVLVLFYSLECLQANIFLEFTTELQAVLGTKNLLSVESFDMDSGSYQFLHLIPDSYLGSPLLVGIFPTAITVDAPLPAFLSLDEFFLANNFEKLAEFVVQRTQDQGIARVLSSTFTTLLQTKFPHRSIQCPIVTTIRDEL